MSCNPFRGPTMAGAMRTAVPAALCALLMTGSPALAAQASKGAGTGDPVRVAQRGDAGAPVRTGRTGYPAVGRLPANWRELLNRHGTFMRHARYGEVWKPDGLPAAWRPYSACHWVFVRDTGWTYNAPERWSAVVHHFGRWTKDHREGWIWLPGRNFAPAWVVWRLSGKFIGWAPMLPDKDIGRINGKQFNEAGMWTFIQTARFGKDCSKVEPQARTGELLRQTPYVRDLSHTNGIAVPKLPSFGFVPEEQMARFAPWEPQFFATHVLNLNWVWNNITASAASPGPLAEKPGSKTGDKASGQITGGEAGNQPGKESGEKSGKKSSKPAAATPDKPGAGRETPRSDTWRNRMRGGRPDAGPDGNFRGRSGRGFDDGRYGDGRYGDGRYGDGRYGDRGNERPGMMRRDAPWSGECDRRGYGPRTGPGMNPGRRPGMEGPHYGIPRGQRRGEPPRYRGDERGPRQWNGRMAPRGREGAGPREQRGMQPRWRNEPGPGSAGPRGGMEPPRFGDGPRNRWQDRPRGMRPPENRWQERGSGIRRYRDGEARPPLWRERRGDDQRRRFGDTPRREGEPSRPGRRTQPGRGAPDDGRGAARRSQGKVKSKAEGKEKDNRESRKQRAPGKAGNRESSKGKANSGNAKSGKTNTGEASGKKPGSDRPSAGNATGPSSSGTARPRPAPRGDDGDGVFKRLKYRAPEAGDGKGKDGKGKDGKGKAGKGKAGEPSSVRARAHPPARRKAVSARRAGRKATGRATSRARTARSSHARMQKRANARKRPRADRAHHAHRRKRHGQRYGQRYGKRHGKRHGQRHARAFHNVCNRRGACRLRPMRPRGMSTYSLYFR